MESRMKKSMPSLWLVTLLDLLAAAMFLLAFFGLRYGPLLLRSRLRAAAPTPAPIVTARPSPTPTAELLTVTGPTATIPPEPTATPDPRTPWQIRFAEHFSNRPVLTENSYCSPEVSVTIERIDTNLGYGPVTYYVADIYVASLENFKAVTPDDRLVYFETRWPLQLDAQANAVVGISGDYFCLSDRGFYVRNGEIYRSDQSRGDICVLYGDGVMETYAAGSYTTDEILLRDPVQVWDFGPLLLDNNGQVPEDFRNNNVVSSVQPRSAIGYYEPGHYCLLVADGRMQWTVGLTLPEMAEIFAALGCTRAYNMDGGGSALMTFNHQIYSKPCDNRLLGDMIVVTDPDFPPAGLE